jgi:hypothetical protein
MQHRTSARLKLWPPPRPNADDRLFLAHELVGIRLVFGSYFVTVWVFGFSVHPHSVGKFQDYFTKAARRCMNEA